jgi:hypothetical protein
MAGTNPQRREQAERFGKLVKRIRESKPRPPNSHGHSVFLTQADLAIRLHKIWKDRHHEDWPFDAAWVGRLERGQVLVDGEFARCVTEALEATRDERTLLMAAVEFNTLPEDVLEDLDIPVHDLPIRICVYIDQVARGESNWEDLLHVVHQLKGVVREEIVRKLRDGESL